MTPRILYFYQLVDAGLIQWSTDPMENERNLLSAAQATWGRAALGWHKLKGLVAVTPPQQQ